MEDCGGSQSPAVAVGAAGGSSDDGLASVASEERTAASPQQQQQAFPSPPHSSPGSVALEGKPDSPPVLDSRDKSGSLHNAAQSSAQCQDRRSNKAFSLNTNEAPVVPFGDASASSAERREATEVESLAEGAAPKQELGEESDAALAYQSATCRQQRQSRQRDAHGDGECLDREEIPAERSSSAAEAPASAKEVSRRVSSSSVPGAGGGGRRRGAEGNLLRLFQSEVFDAHFHLYYLFRRQEAGVQQYLVNMLYTRRSAQEVQFYLPQLCQLALTRFSSSPLQRYLLDICSVSIHLALKAAWLFQASVEDRIPGIEEAAQKMTQEVEMAVVNCRPLGHSGYSSGAGGAPEGGSSLLKGSDNGTGNSAEAPRQEEWQQQWQQQQRSVDPTLFKRNSIYKIYLERKRAIEGGAVCRQLDCSPDKQLADVAAAAVSQPQTDQGQAVHADPVEAAPGAAQQKLHPPVLPSVFRSNTGPVSLPGAKVRLPSVYAKLGNPLSLTTLTPPAPCCSSTGGCCKDPSCLAAELHQFVMKQRRCDYFNALNHFVSILVDASNILAAEPDRTMRLFVAAQAANFALTGVTVPLQQVGAEPMQPPQQQSRDSEDKACSRARKQGMGLGGLSLGLSPPSNFAVQILRIDSRESKTLNSKKRAPFLIVLEDLQEFSNDPERQREEIQTKSLFVLQCIVKELKQRKLLPSGCSADSEPVRTVRQVLGMLPVASSASAAGGSATRSAGSSSGARLEQLTTTAAAAAPWRPLQRQPTATSKAGAAAVAAAAVAAATAAAALTGESEEAASAPEASEASSAEARSAATGSGDASTAAAALKVSENHFAHKPQKEISETPAAAPVKTNALWGELWAARRERLRRRSPYGNLKSWDIKCVLVKGGDDLRQELLASQLVRQFKAIFEEARLPLWLRPYEILVTGSNSGLMECIPDTCSVDVLKKKHGVDSIATVFDILFADNPFEARKNFIESHAAYSLVSYFLQVKDRHNGNLLLDAEGHVIHIDYGFLLSNSPGNINFETAPFKLTQEFLDVMGGEISDNYEYFRTLIVRGFLEARKHADRIVLMVEMMLSASKMPCFAGGPQYTLEALKERFMCALPEDACIEKVVELIDTSVNNFRTVQYDNFQRITNGIL